MNIEIQYLDGPRSGTRLAFRREIEIRFGRDGRRCQVSFPPDGVRIRREHCAVRLVLGRYRLFLNGEEPVELDGRWARDGEVLGQIALLRLGPRGPRLRITIERQEDLATTVALGGIAPGAATGAARGVEPGAEPSVEPGAERKPRGRSWPRGLWANL